jgi:hypothetical protein
MKILKYIGITLLISGALFAAAYLRLMTSLLLFMKLKQ